MGWLSEWDYRKSINISRATGAVTDYQLKLLVGESSGATGEDVDCGGKCLSNFNDLRFTAADGTTLLDYWIETISGTTPNQLATVWIKFNTIGTSDTTFYMYYGNASAAAYSNGTNTFIIFDDFERGSDGDTVGGDWTDTTAGAAPPLISTAQKYGGTRSAKIYSYADGFPLPGGMETAVTASDNISIMFRIYKNPNGEPVFSHGDGSSLQVIAWQNGGRLYYRDSSWNEVELAPSPAVSSEEWHLFEFNNFNWATNSFDLLIDEVIIGSGLVGPASTGENNKFIFNSQNYNPGTNITWIDNFIVRNYRTTEPAWGSWGSEENKPPNTSEEIPIVQTYEATSETPSSFVANGEVTSSGSISERGFWYTDDNKEPTAADYIESETGEFTTGLFDLTVTAPIPGIDYKVKAYAVNDSGVGFGETITVSLPDAVNAVTVETLPETLITTTSFTANGIITNAGQNWYINGVLFTGTVVRVAAGQNATSIIAAATVGSLIIIEPGVTGSALLINKRVYIKGLGNFPTDTVMPNFQWTLSAGCGGSIVENLTVPQICNNDTSNSGQSFIFNQCIVGDPNGSTFNLQNNTTRLYFINCQLVRSATGYTQPNAFSSTPARLGYIFLQKVEFNLTPRYGTNYVYGPIAENDYVETPTSGYGYIYNGVLQGTQKITVTGTPNATARGFVYSTGTIENPNLLDYDGIYTESGDFGEGSFNHLFSGLTEGTNYRYRAYATNPYGTSYGDPEQVTTTEAEPFLDIYAATSIDLTSFSISGKITYNGGSTPTIRGFVYKIGTGTPTILDKDGIFTESGSFGGDVFSNVFSGLTPNTTYTIAAYATNSYATGYSSTVQVVTLPNLVITTNECTNITASSFRANATISPSTFGVTVVGFLYTIDEEPYSWQTSSSSGDYTGTANFSKVIGAATNKYYLVKAYVDYRGHTYYGESVLVSTIVLTGITVTPVLPEISIGQTVQLTVVGTYSDSSVVDITNSSFYSAEDLAEFIPIEGQAGAFNVISTTGQIIASVSSGGLIVGMSAGLAKIFIYASEYKTSYNLVVVQPDEGTVDVGGIWDGEIAPGTILPNTNAISIIMDEVMYEGDSQQAYLLGMFDDSPETEAYVSNFDAVWSSSNTDVATVDAGGLIIGVAAGITFIKAVYTLEDSPVQTFTTMVMLRVEAKEGQWVIGQTYQYIPLMPIPNQLFRTTIATSKDRSIDLNIFLCWNKETICWEMTISDPISEEYYVDSIPLFVGEDSMFNLLRLYQYLNIGSCYIVDISGKGTGKPALNNLGVDFLMVWGYTE